MAINLIDRTAGTKNEEIIEWRVVFFVAPLGIYLNLKDALEAAAIVEDKNKLNLVTSLLVVPMVAALTETEMEISYRG